MAKPTQVALAKQLKRELQHQAWLRKHLPKAQQLQSQRRILVTRTKLSQQLGSTVDQ
jgi:hypothetical protein